MADKKHQQFKQKANSILDGGQRPSSISELMAADAQDENTENRKNGSTENRKKREEFQLPVELADMLREYAHLNRTKKTSVVIEALNEFFEHRKFSISTIPEP